MDKVKIIFVGLGGRGRGLLGLLCQMNDVEVVAVCDLLPERVEKGVEIVEKQQGHTPAASLDYKELFRTVKADAVITPSSWQNHAEICIAAMKAGMYAATEVGGATSIEQCWELVRTSRETGMPCMMLENCCYGEFELAIFNLVRKGFFGELVHAEGGYRHDLRAEVALGHERHHYRLDNYKRRNGDVYPTHALGPIAKTLDINRGNRMVSLVSVASKARGVNRWILDNRGEEFENAREPFALGDVVTTIITCANGETITLTHDTTLPRPYSRNYIIQGTKGIASEDANFSISIEGLTPQNDSWDPNEWRPMKEYYETHGHPLWKTFRDTGVKSGHGGMDYLVLRAFIEAVRDKTDTPIDVYDTAAWMAITPLSEDSVACGGKPIAIPDFTEGRWLTPRPVVRGKYCLDEICEDAYEGITAL